MNRILLLLVLAFTQLYSEANLNDAQNEISIGKEIEYLEVKEDNLNFEAVKLPENLSRFKKSEIETPNFGHTLSAYWFKFKVTNHSSESDWFYQMRFPVMDYFSFFSPDSSGNYTEKKSGAYIPFSERDVDNRNYVFKLHLEKGESKEIFIYAKTSGNLQLPSSIIKKDAFIKEDTNQKFLFGFYFGMMCVIAVYNFFLFLAVKDLSYMYYVTYILSFIFIQLGLSGLGAEYVWPNFSWMTLHYYPLFTGVSISGVSLFNKYFLKTKEKFRKSNIFLNISIGIGIVLMLSTVTLPTYLSIQLAVSLVLLPIIGSFIIAISALRNGFSPARYFLVAFSVLIAAVLIILFRSINLLPTNFITEYGMYIGSAIEVVLLSFALADRINILKREKEATQKEALVLQTQLTESYARFVPKEFLVILSKDSILDVKLGDQVLKNMSIMFADIRSFTTLSEKMAPKENFNFINSYLKRMSPIIKDNGGYIDKFMGDGIMALFSGSADNAIKAAVDMQKYLIHYNIDREYRGYKAIDVGIGVNTGMLMLGAIGGENRMEGTVISDTVNLASRIESLTKTYGVKIATSEWTFNSLANKDQYLHRFLDRVKVKGKNEPVIIYEIFDGDTPESIDLKAKTMQDYNQGIKLYYDKKFEECRPYFQNVLQTNANDKVAEMYIQRSHYSNRSSDWDGSERMLEK